VHAIKATHLFLEVRILHLNLHKFYTKYSGGILELMHTSDWVRFTWVIAVIVADF